MSRCAGVARRLLQGAWQSGPCIAGQPIVATHPEVWRWLKKGFVCLYRSAMHVMRINLLVQLLLDGEIWPGVNASEFVTRRERLASSLPAGGLAIVPAAEKVCMSGAIPYTYRQVFCGLLSPGVAWPPKRAALVLRQTLLLQFFPLGLQDSDFLYLTGINQQAIAVIHNSLPQCQSTFTLYLPNSTAQVCPDFK